MGCRAPLTSSQPDSEHVDKLNSKAGGSVEVSEFSERSSDECVSLQS